MQVDEVVTLEPVAVKRATAARMLDCSTTTIHRLIAEKKLSTIKVGSDLRITMASIRRFAEKPAA